MATDLNSKEGRKKFISEYLDDLLTGINESYGPILLEELQKRLEFTIDEFNEEINEAFSMLKKRDSDRKSFFKETLEEQGWAMGDIVQVRAFAVAGDDGLDFAGFNAGYAEFFGTSDNPNKPVRSFVEIKDLVVEGWLIEIEIRAARMP